MKNGAYENLIAQLDKLARHNRQGSYRTRERYYEAMQRFCAFLAVYFNLQKLSNISGKHIEAYVRWMQEGGKSPSTIKTDLSAIRFWHDKIDRPRCRNLPSNSELNLERRKFGGVDRSWTEEELEEFCGACLGFPGYRDVAMLGYYAGLRVHECFRLDTAAVEEVMRTGCLTVKGKGGRTRTVRIPSVLEPLLQEAKSRVKRGHKLFVDDDETTDEAIADYEAFVRAHRPGSPSGAPAKTHHGLRHSYAANQYESRVSAGVDPDAAKLEVSLLLGHGRPDVTNIYISGKLK